MGKGPIGLLVYAVNASFIQLAPVFYPETLPIAQSWISQTPPTGKIGDSWYYFEISGTISNRSDKILFSAPFLQHRGYYRFQ